MPWFNDDPDQYKVDCICRECCVIRTLRLEGLGAIRRAAEVAREFDGDAETLRKRCHSIIDGKQSGDVARLNGYRTQLRIEAAIVRRAIRAAIGSEKA